MAAGRKKFEYRRQLFARPVRTVVVYATAPIGKAIGEFDIKGVIYESIDRLWKVTRNHGGIDESLFRAYFTGKEMGYAIEIGQFRRYRQPYDIQTRHGVRPPQSFLYLRALPNM